MGKIKREYVTVSVPKGLASEIDNVIKEKKYGYKSRAEFIKEAIRKLLSERR